MSRVIVVAAVALLLGYPMTSTAQPVADNQRIPVDVRRTTLIVRDMEKSLAFWRDAIGLTMVYDRVLGAAPAQQRLVLLRANDEFIGAIGLLERFDTRDQMPPVTYERAKYGQVIFVINAKDLETRIEKVKKVPGARIQSGPDRIEYPSPDGKGIIPVLQTNLWDPDGYFVELNKILGTAAGATKKPGGR